MEQTGQASGLMAELTETRERADAAVELALQTQQRLKIREEVLTLQVVVQESLKKSIEDSRERALREVEKLKAELLAAKISLQDALKDNEIFRELLWMTHSTNHLLYGDDGRMSCNTCLIDFKETTAKRISEQFAMISRIRLEGEGVKK